jgi:uncharacterized membrane protein YccC
VKQLLMLAVIVVAAGLGALAGLGGATVLAALPAMFCLIAAFGGTLRGDLRLLAWFGPLLVLVVGGLKSLGSVTQWPAITLVTVIVFLAGLLPVLGTRYVTVGMGLGMASTFAYGFQLGGPTTLAQDFAAPSVSVAVVLAARLLLGWRDPDAPLRAALAEALRADTVTGREQALWLWRSDGPRGWTTSALTGTLRYQNAHRVLLTRRPMLADAAGNDLDQVLAAAEAEAERLAAEISLPAAPDPTDRVRRREPRMLLPGATRQLVTSIWLALEAVRAASADRDRSRSDIPRHLERERLRQSLRGALGWRSAQLRHAVRCALGMLVALGVSLWWAADPLRLSFLMATFAIMQPQLGDTIARARQRVVGTMAGAATLALLIVLVGLPQQALVPVGVVALSVGFLFFMQTKPVVFNACVVLMSVGLNVNIRHLELGRTLLEYLLLMVLAVAIALGFGFLAVPGVPRPSLSSRFEEAVRGGRDLLRQVAAALVTRNVTVSGLRPGFRAAVGAQQNLSATDSVRPEPTPEQEHAARQASEALRDLLSAASALLMRARASTPLAAAVGEIAHQLDPEFAPDPGVVFDRLPSVIEEEQQLLLNGMIAGVLAVSQAAPLLRAPSPNRA